MLADYTKSKKAVPSTLRHESYEKLDRFYDAAMGDRTAMASCLRPAHPSAQTEGEHSVGAWLGTGAVLKIVAKYYDVAGLDLSPQMLLIARKKLPFVRLYRKDMVRFDLGIVRCDHLCVRFNQPCVKVC